jgi:ABC-type transport system involved in cytochrome bd biosynthesis fused ATPase/permease subunit
MTTIEMKKHEDTSLVVEIEPENVFQKMFKASFVEEAKKRVMKDPLTFWYIVCDVVSSIILSIISAQLMIKIAAGEKMVVPYQIGISLFVLFVDNVVLKQMSTKIGIRTTNDFIKDTNELYSKVHYEERANKTAAGAKEKKDSAKFSFYMVSDWGIPTLINLIGNGLSVLTTFFVKKMMIQFVLCSAIGVLFYYCYVQKKQHDFTELDKEMRKNVQRISELVRLKTTSFQGGETKEEEMTNLETDIENKKTDVRMTWIIIGSTVSIVNQLISTVIIILSTSNLTEYILYYVGYGKHVDLSMFNTQDYILFSMVLMQWSGAVSSVVHFMTQYNGMKSDYDNFVDYWKDVRFAEEPAKMEIKSDLKITSYIVKRENQVFRFDDSISEIPYNIGVKYLVLGPTGHGKSTFVNAILGKITGMTMNFGTPPNYYHHAADMFQSIREKMPASKITIRDWFKSETDNDFIMRMMMLTIEQKKVEEIMENFGKRGKTLHPFDVEINEEISGGQKTALCLATRCYEIEKFNKKVLILDEPEQGLGRRAVKVMNNIYEKYQNITIINSTHLYRFELQAIKSKIDLIFWVENGVVKAYKSLEEMTFLDSLDYE